MADTGTSKRKVMVGSQENSGSNGRGASGTTGNNILQLVGFHLGDELFGVDILKVQEINRMVEVTRIPNSPDFVEGVINLRGAILPVINLRKRFGLDVGESTKATRIVVVENGDHTIGFIVDSVSEVLRIPKSTIEPPPSIVAGVDSDYIKGVGKLQSVDGEGDNLLILINLDRVFSGAEKRLLRKVTTSAETASPTPSDDIELGTGDEAREEVALEEVSAAA